MKKQKVLLVLFAVLCSSYLFAQTKSTDDFQGAQPTLKSYKVLYFIDQSDDKKIKATIRNINNALDDPRLKGKLTVEFVAFGDGMEMFKTANPYDTLLMNLKNRGVILAQCLNTMKERKITKEELQPFISYVPSGNGEIIIRQQQGWAIVHP